MMKKIVITTTLLSLTLLIADTFLGTPISSNHPKPIQQKKKIVKKVQKKIKKAKKLRKKSIKKKAQKLNKHYRDSYYYPPYDNWHDQPCYPERRTVIIREEYYTPPRYYYPPVERYEYYHWRDNGYIRREDSRYRNHRRHHRLRDNGHIRYDRFKNR